MCHLQSLSKLFASLKDNVRVVKLSSSQMIYRAATEK